MPGNQEYGILELEGVVDVVVVQDDGGAKDNPYGDNDSGSELVLGGSLGSGCGEGDALVLLVPYGAHFEGNGSFQVAFFLVHGSYINLGEFRDSANRRSDRSRLCGWNRRETRGNRRRGEESGT